jgi:hypothetical protein
MELLLTRYGFDAVSTIGKLTENGALLCYTLEDKDRGLDSGMDAEIVRKKKVDGKTAIPYGRYEINCTYSPRFKRVLPQLMAVKGFAGIRIHPGNFNEDTEGCLLPGLSSKYSKQKGFYVEQSRTAFESLYDKIGRALLNEKVFITIQRGPDPIV